MANGDGMDTNGRDGAEPSRWVDPGYHPKQHAEPLPKNIYSFLFAITKSFGFPALIALLLIGYVYRTEHDHESAVQAQIAQERVDRASDQKAFLDALAKNTEAVQNLGLGQAATNAKLDTISDELRYHASEHK